MMQIQYVDDAAYRPGACNIGPAELARRRQAAVGASIALVAVAAAILVLGLPPITRWAILPVAIGTAVAWEQALRRFCVAFGAAGVLNFGDAVGRTTRVEDPEALRADRRQARRMVVESVAIGLVVTIAFALLPL